MVKHKKNKHAKKIVEKDSNRVKVILNPKKKQLRRDFEVFAKGVERLEELRAELNKLDAGGFEEEASAIRSKLKNVSYIPEIEEELAVLKSKINGTHKGKTVIAADNSGIKKKINNLEKEIKQKKIHAKKQLSKEQVGDVKTIPRLESQLSYLKKFVEEQKREEERKREILKNIDPGVNFLINNKLNMSLNEIKAELSNKLKNRESEIKEQLQEDLEARKKNFEQQYRAVEDEFAKKYQDKIAASLQKEVNSRFNDALKKRVDNFKKKLEAEAAQKISEKKSELDAKEQVKLIAIENYKKDVMEKLSKEHSEKIDREKKSFDGERRKLEESFKIKEKALNDNIIKKERGLKGSYETKKSLLKRLFMGKEKKLKKSLSEEEIKFKKEADKKEEMRIKIALENLRKKRDYLINKLNEKSERNLAYQKAILKERENKVLRELNKEHENLKKQIRVEKETSMKVHEKEMEVKITEKQFEELKEKLKREFEMKKNNLERTYGANLLEEKRRMKKYLDEQILIYRTRMNNQMHEHLTGEVKKLHANYNRKHNEEQARINRMKERIANEQGIIAKIRNRLSVDVQQFKQNEKVYRARIKADVEREKHEAIKKAVAEQSAAIKEQLKNEFKQRLKMEIRAKEAEFERKKAELALEIQNKAKALFS